MGQPLPFARVSLSHSFLDVGNRHSSTISSMPNCITWTKKHPVIKEYVIRTNHQRFRNHRQLTPAATPAVQRFYGRDGRGEVYHYLRRQCAAWRKNRRR